MTEETKAAATAVAEKQPRARQTTRKARSRTFSDPAYIRKLSLSSSQSQRVYDRSFNRVSYALFQIDVTLQIITSKIGDRNAIDAMETKIRELIEHVSKDLEGEVARCKKLLDDNGITEMVSYSKPREVDVALTSPQAIQFARLMAQLDELMLLTDTLWLNTVFNSRQRTDAIYVWQQRLIKLASRIIGEKNRARAAAKRAGLSSEVDEQAPEMEAEEDEELDADTEDEEDDGDTADEVAAVDEEAKTA